MKTVSLARLWGSTGLGLLGILVGAGVLSTTARSAPPFPNYINTWRSLYPGSTSDDNVENGTGSVCQLCHQEVNGGDGWNGYGWRIREGLNSGMNLAAAIAAAEPFDSDMDPTASTNLVEIGADTQPGWTPGANNTIYFEDGTTQTNQPPPAGILGSLDPMPGGLGTPDPACVPTMNSAGSVATIELLGSGNAGDPISATVNGGVSGQFGYFISGPNSGLYIIPPNSAGMVCIAGPQYRYNSGALNQVFQFDAGGVSQALGGGGPLTLPTDGSFAPVPAVLAGETRAFQAWYRDVSPANSNFSDSRRVTFN